MYCKLDGRSRRVRTPRGSAEHRAHHVGSLPLIRHFLDRMAFLRIVGSCLGTGRETPTHAQTLALLVENILLSPAPLYRIAEWAAPFSAAALGLTLAEKVRSETRVALRRLRRGRPRNSDPVEEIRSRHFRLEYQRLKEAIRAESRTDGVFPLVTNLRPRRVSKKALLLIYKYQPYVEKRHSLLKTELEVAPVYLKKPRRAAGLVHAAFLAMMLDALIERALRKGMARQRLKTLPILPEGRPSMAPTTARILEIFSDVCWYESERGDETVTFPIELTPLQRQLLGLLEVDPAIYR